MILSSRIDALPSVADVVRQLSLSAKKSFGQHFLFDLNLTAKIASAALDLKKIPVIEIGPGPGGLTRSLLSQGATVIAIEKDSRFIQALAPLVEAADEKLKIIEADALDISLDSLFSNAPYQVVANLPYNVGTELLIQWTKAAKNIQALTLMFQKEVVDRIIASPNSKDYGRLSILCQWRFTAEKIMDISPQAFTPPPKVWSSVVQLIPRQHLDETILPKLEKITAAAFGQRRKMLRQSLKSIWGPQTESILESLHIDPTRRAETLEIAEFITLARHLK